MALVGIARMAAQSPLLEAKRAVQYFEIPARSILNRTKPAMPFRWTINPYRGCEFGCKYCYARYTHEFMEMAAEEFEDRIYAKAASAHLLRQELRRIDRSDHIAMGTATDPYQPAERRFGLTRSALEVLATTSGRKIYLTTKSDFVTRDIELWQAVSKKNEVSISMTVTTTDHVMARLLEPYAPRPDLRLAAVSALAEAGLRVGVIASPVLPLITDSEESLEAVAKAAAAAGAVSFSAHVLFLKPCSQRVFFPFLDEQFPHLAARYRTNYEDDAYLRGTYPGRIRKLVEEIRERTGLAPRDLAELPSPPAELEQMRLF